MGNTARKMFAAMGLSTMPADPALPEGDYSAEVQPPSRANLPGVTLSRALGLPAVLRAISLTAGMAAQLQLDSWRGPELVTPAPSLVTQPDPWRTADSWVERFVVNLATDGNNFLRKHRGPGDQVAALEVLNPYAVTIQRKRVGGRLIKSYLYADPHAGRTVELKADDVVHTWGLEVPGMDRGLGPIGHCRAALTGVLDVRDYADRWFRDEATDGVLTTDQRLDPAATKQYKNAWYTRDEADPAGPRIRVMGAGLKYEPIMLRPEDAQWVQAQSFGVLDIARMFGMPADYLLAAVEGTSLTYANLEMIDAQFLRTTLFPLYLRKIENALSSALPRGQRARFRTGELLRPDAKTRAEIDAIYLPAGVIGADEIRAREGWAGPAPAKTTTRPATPAENEATR